MNRREFLRTCGAGVVGWSLWPSLAPARAEGADADEAQIRRRIEAHRPSRRRRLPRDFPARVGAAHVAGKYHFTDRPFLLEGAERLLALGTRLGKFWFTPERIAHFYPFNSRWPECKSLLDLARSEYFERLWDLPFATLLLEAMTEREWPAGGASSDEIASAYFELTAYLYRRLRDRPVTVILQNWEGDWLLRGRGGELWRPPPADWPQRCDAMVGWIRARQRGVSRARAEFGRGARCRVAHALEVNRVTDLWAGIPTVTEHVLPRVRVDLVSYSCYDGMSDGVTLWKCIAEIRRRARTTGMFGPRAVCIGEVGIPENERPQDIPERWDELLGAMLASQVRYIALWELYCNELNPRLNPPPAVPVKNPDELRGFWLVKPDGTLSETGRFFRALWERGGRF